MSIDYPAYFRTTKSSAHFCCLFAFIQFTPHTLMLTLANLHGKISGTSSSKLNKCAVLSVCGEHTSKHKHTHKHKTISLLFCPEFNCQLLLFVVVTVVLLCLPFLIFCFSILICCLGCHSESFCSSRSAKLLFFFANMHNSQFWF